MADKSGNTLVGNLWKAISAPFTVDPSSKGAFDETLQVLWAIIEVVAAARAGFATWSVCMAVSGGDLAFTVLTVASVEGALLSTLYLIGHNHIAIFAAAAAIAFSGAMQWFDIMLITKQLSSSDKQVLYAVIAFSPIAILVLALLRNIVRAGLSTGKK